MIDKIDWKKVNGLVPAVIQNNENKQFLMLGYMNAEALGKTLETKKVTFFSRTKQRLWTKGETSGNFLELIDISLDCDNDSLLIQVNPKGNTCHLDRPSCFDHFDLHSLEEIINERAQQSEGYTASLLNGPYDRLVQKLGEEAIEVTIAAKNQDKQELINEFSDLLYHGLVLLKKNELGLKDIEKRLEERSKK